MYIYKGKNFILYLSGNERISISKVDDNFRETFRNWRPESSGLQKVFYLLYRKELKNVIRAQLKVPPN